MLIFGVMDHPWSSVTYFFVTYFLYKSTLNSNLASSIDNCMSDFKFRNWKASFYYTVGYKQSQSIFLMYKYFSLLVGVLRYSKCIKLSFLKKAVIFEGSVSFRHN